MSSYIPDPDFNPGQMLPHSGPDQRPAVRAGPEEVPRKAAHQLQDSAKQFRIERARKGYQARWQNLADKLIILENLRGGFGGPKSLFGITMLGLATQRAYLYNAKRTQAVVAAAIARCQPPLGLGIKHFRWLVWRRNHTNFSWATVRETLQITGGEESEINVQTAAKRKLKRPLKRQTLQRRQVLWGLISSPTHSPQRSIRDYHRLLAEQGWKVSYKTARADLNFLRKSI